MEKAMANSEQSWVATGGGKDEKTEEPIMPEWIGLSLDDYVP